MHIIARLDKINSALTQRAINVLRRVIRWSAVRSMVRRESTLYMNQLVCARKDMRDTYVSMMLTSPQPFPSGQ